MYGDIFLHGSQPCHGEGACVTQWSYEPCCAGLRKMDGSQWSTGGGNCNSLQYSCLENPTDNTKRQKDMTMEDEPPRLEGVQYATGKEQRAITNTSRENEVAAPKQKWRSVVDVSSGESKIPCYKEQYCIGARVLGPWIKVNQEMANWKSTF